MTVLQLPVGSQKSIELLCTLERKVLARLSKRILDVIHLSNAQNPLSVEEKTQMMSMLNVQSSAEVSLVVGRCYLSGQYQLLLLDIRRIRAVAADCVPPTEAHRPHRGTSRSWIQREHSAGSGGCLGRTRLGRLQPPPVAFTEWNPRVEGRQLDIAAGESEVGIAPLNPT